MVLIIEDDAEIREVLQDSLELEGYDVTTYANGREALDALPNHPDACLILLDLMMPIMDGWEFMRERRTLDRKFTDVPVVIVSAIADKIKVEQAGATDYIRKPLDLNGLLLTVRKYCVPNVA